MPEPSYFDDFRKRTLDHHYELYLAFTRLVLSLSTGSFSLMAALSGNLFSSAQYTYLAKFAFPLLLVSILSGVLVQYRVLYRPLRELDKTLSVLQANADMGKDEIVFFRKLPTVLERIAFQVQVGSFVLAFMFLSAYAVLFTQPPYPSSGTPNGAPYVKC